MVETPSPTMRKRQLGWELKRLREAAGKNQDEAARWVGVLTTAISKMENGKQRVSPAYLKLLLQLYDVGSPHADALFQLARESGQRGWWVSYGDSVPVWFADYVGMETAAAEVWTYESELVPGLLQTPAYTEAVTRSANPNLPPDRVDQAVAFRQARQRRLTSDDPVRVHAVLNEAVLRRTVGGPEVMAEQLDRLVAVAALPNVTVQVLPFAAGAHPAMIGSFATLRFPAEPMNTVYIELDGGAAYLEKPAEVARYAATFERLARQALTEEDSATWLTDFQPDA